MYDIVGYGDYGVLVVNVCVCFKVLDLVFD